MSPLTRGLALSAALNLGATFGPLPAAAWHDTHPVPDYAASTLNAGELRLGLFKAGFGLTDWLQFETYTLPWVVGAANVSAKAAIWQPRDWTLALEVGLLAWNPARLRGTQDAVDTPIAALPLSAHATWQPIDPLRWSLTVGYTATRATADISASEAEATGAVSTGRAATSLEWRLGRVLALVLEAHLMLTEHIRADASVSRQLDADTTLTLYGDGELDAQRPWRGNVSLSALWSFETFNLRLGAGYGHYRVPMVSYFIPEPIPFPELALFWRL